MTPPIPFHALFAGVMGKQTWLGVQGRSEATVQIVRFPVGPAQTTFSNIA